MIASDAATVESIPRILALLELNYLEYLKQELGI
jgi:hypothetical protein